MSKMKKAASLIKRVLIKDPNPFPIDAWTASREYRDWFDRHKTTPEELDRQRSTEFAIAPLFSFIVPLYKTPREFLTHMADSVLEQTYGNFELVLVNASPDNDDLVAMVADYSTRDSRVKAVTLDKNYGITENTNRGIEAAQGDFVCFLDHDDYIEPNLLFEYVSAINVNPEIDVLYCDEDLVTYDKGSFHAQHPLFKPAFSPELLLCKNYIIHLMTIRRSLIDSMPTPDSRYDGAQDYNMISFATHHARCVHNVPKVLYHWRMSAGSTAADPQAKPYGRRVSRLSAQNQLARCRIKGRIVSSGIINLHNIWFAGFDMSDNPKASIVVKCDESENLSTQFIESFLQTNSYNNCEIIFVGHNRGDLGYSDLDLPIQYVEVESNLGLFGCFNAGARCASGEFLVFMNEGDFFSSPEFMEQLISLLSIEGVGIVAPKTLYSTGENRTYGVAVTSERIMPLYRGYPDEFPGYQCNLRAFQNCSAVSYRGMVVSREVFLSLNGFDEDYKDEIGTADFCRKVIGLGKRIVQTPTVKLQTNDVCPNPSYDNASNAPEYLESDLLLFDSRWPGVREQGDPYFNGNLDQRSCYLQVDARH